MSTILSLGCVSMQLVASFIGEQDGMAWLLSSKQILFRAVTFIPFSDLYWTKLSRLSRSALQSCTLISCPIFQASVSSDFLQPLANIPKLPMGTSLNQTCRPHTKLFSVPNSQLLVKYKSKEHKAGMKAQYWTPGKLWR